jgi:protein SCO1/2
MNAMTRALALLFSLCLTSLALAELTLPSATSKLKAGVFEPPRPAPEFSLQGSDGAELRLSRYRGKLVLMSFGFTDCAAVCPVTLATLAQVRKSLGTAADSVQVIFITVDSERDDAARLKTYLAAFDPTFVGGTAKPETLAAMRKEYGVIANKHLTGDSYVFDHASSIYLIDHEGKLRAMMPYGHDAEDFVHDVKLLLAR